MTSPNASCANCSSTGLAILPVRYSVVPSAVQASAVHAEGIAGKRVYDVNLSKEYSYALRTLRQGFLYLYFEKQGPRGNKYWEAYSVAENGHVLKQIGAPWLIIPAEKTISCSRQGHLAARTSYFCIEQPEKCGTVWLAFTEHQWSPETLKQYETDSALRSARMQAIEPAAWVTSPQLDHAAKATPSTIEHVIEYNPSGYPNMLQPPVVKALSTEDGLYSASLLAQQSTRYPLYMRVADGKSQSTELHKLMLASGKKDANSSHPPMVFALWDAIGITHELNGFRSEASGRVAQYGQERELQITAYNAIEGLKVALADSAEGQVEAHRALAHSATESNQQGSGAAMQKLASQHPGDPRYAEAAGLQTQWEAQSVPSSYTRQLYMLLQNYPASMWRSEADKLKADVNAYLSTRDPIHKKDVAEARAGSWPKYEAKLDLPAQASFKKNWDALSAAATQLIDQRTEVLVRWLEAPLFIDTLEDFHPQNIEDGVIFEDVVGDAIFGIGSSASGAKKIDEWITQAKASIKSNLLWRAIALNQREGIPELDAALALAQNHQKQRTVADALKIEDIVGKSLKVFASTYKNAAGIVSANDAAAGATGSRVFGARIKPINTRGIDKIAMTFGDDIVRHFKVDGLADYVSEKIIQHMFSVRALVDPQDSLALIVAQAADESASRGRLLARMRVAKTFLATDQPEMRTVQTEHLAAAWNKVKLGGPLKNARLAVLVMLIEGLNFQKLLGDCTQKNDAKGWFSLAASGMTIASALFDIASVPAKEVFGATKDGIPGVETWSYQRLKFTGGMLSAGATFIGVIFDAVSAEKSRERQQYLLAALYGGKAFLGAWSLGLTLATTFTHAAPLIGRLTGKEVAVGAARAVGARAAAVIGTRILFMSAGAWITVGTFTIQVLIWVYTDDDLQSWCELCAFGKKHSKSWTAKKQMDELTAALKAVGV